MTFWHVALEELLSELKASKEGLSSKESRRRLKVFGPNRLKAARCTGAILLFLGQFKSPLILLLLFAAVLSLAFYNHTDAAIILAIVIGSAILGFVQEKGAHDAVARLLKMVEARCRVIRDGTEKEVGLESIVPGDIVVLSAGDVIPGDCRIVEEKDLFVNEAPLTGEPYAVEKNNGVVEEEAPLGQRSNALWMGSYIISGSAHALVVRTGRETEFGRLSQHLKLRPPVTAFEHGIHRFGYFLMEVTVVLTAAIFAVNLWLERPLLEAFLFSLALAVGLTPQLLPAIVTINLSKGARKMAAHKVIVKKLSAIEDFGGMDILCVDKTGTVTEGAVQLHGSFDREGKTSELPLRLGHLNAFFQTGYRNPIDQMLISQCSFETKGWKKLDEIPYDFVRKRLTVVVSNGEEMMITKGAFHSIASICKDVDASIERQFEKYSREGYRVLAVAYKNCSGEESEMTFAGFLVLTDPLKEGIAETVDALKKLGVGLKLITGDNELAAQHVARALGIGRDRVALGKEIDALMDRVEEIDVFAETEPNQKERIILALRRKGHTVGYMGDGINDATALHAADVGISVDTAADVVKEVADIVLLRKDLAVLKQGIQEGRKTFANTLKYIFMATSANFGNMFSMAGASIFLSFLPLLPKQILLTNLLTDFPEMTIATDRVDHEMTEKPVRWDLGFIRRFMMVFGCISSVFDYATFAILLWVFRAAPEAFRTGWFVESVVSAALIVLVIRTRRPFWRSLPSRALSGAVFAIVALTFALPFTPLASLFAFTTVPAPLYLFIVGIVMMYVGAAELAKLFFWRLSRSRDS